MFSEYDHCLSQEYSIDFWSDEGICAACEILSKFSVDDWNVLAIRWQDHTAGWKVRCAETIDSHSSHLVVRILLDMLLEEDGDVVIAAADSLRSMMHQGASISSVNLGRIMRLRDCSGTAVKAVLSDFIERINT